MKVYLVLSTSFYVVNVSVSNFKVYLAPKIICFSDWGIVYSNKLVFLSMVAFCNKSKLCHDWSLTPCYFFSSPLVEIEERFVIQDFIEGL